MKSATVGRWAMSGLVLVLAGCAGYTPRVKPEEVPTAQDAYLYGRFRIDAPKAALAFDGHRTMGLAIQCDGGERYVVRFDVSDPLLAVRIKPGVCTWVENVFTDADGSVRTRKPVDVPEFKSVKLEAGQAYYLGDMQAEVKTSNTGTSILTEWRITSARHLFKRTSRDLLAAYPNLSGLTLHDMALLQKPIDADYPGKSIAISDAEVRAEYDRLFALQGDTEYHARHILLSSEDDVAKVKTALGERRSFAVLAQDFSKDTGSRAKGGDLGWAVPKDFTPLFGEALAKLKPGDITPEPVKTEFGWHFIQLVETRPNVVPDYEDIQARLKVAMQTQRAKDEAKAAAPAPAGASSDVSAAQAAAKPASEEPRTRKKSRKKKD